MFSKIRKECRMGNAGFTLIELMIVIAIIGILAAVAIPNFIRARNKSQYTACMEQLAHIKTGIESYMSENDALTTVNVPDDMCHHILPGFDQASECVGEVQKRIDDPDTGVCAAGTFTFKTNTGYDYELTANAKEKTNCAICVTEVTATPKKYDECLAPPGCTH